MKKIVLTGGPCAGKTTVVEVLRQEFAGRLLVVPEAATMLLSGGFPVPGRDIQWSSEWQDAFQSAILPVQTALEAAYELKAVQAGAGVIVCDRGRLDGAAYTPGGLAEFCRRYGVEVLKALAAYDAVMHLESVAVGDPVFYGKANNSARFEDLAEAAVLDQRIRSVWQCHPNWNLITCEDGLEGKVREVCRIIRGLL